MKKQFAQFTGNIPENYEKGLVPYIFSDFARDLTDRVAEMKPGTLLETAAGTGIVTKMLQEALDNGTAITATDLNPAMLEIAQQKLGNTENIELIPADATELPFEDNVYDAVVCQFGVMFFPDKEKAYREVYRILTPGGKYIFNVWDSFEINSYARIAHETIASYFSEDPPEFLKLPFGYYQTDDIRDSLANAGFTDISHNVLTRKKKIKDAEEFARGLVCGNPSINEINERCKTDPKDVVVALAKALRMEFGDDPGEMEIQAIFFNASKPD